MLIHASNSLKGLGFNTFQTNLLVIPSQVLSMITLLTFTRVAGWTKRLAFNGIIGQIWALPFLIALYTIDTTTANKWVVWAIVSLLLGYPSNHSVQVGRLPPTASMAPSKDGISRNYLLTLYPSRLGITQCKHSPYAYSVNSHVQYVLSSRIHRILQYLSQRYILSISPSNNKTKFNHR
jgi:hypothetical protein